MFSYICKVCGKSIKGNTSAGERCQLFFLKDGNIVERMVGQYNGNGAVFDNNNDESLTWKHDNWNNLVDLHFSDNNNNGFAAYHERCYRNQRPITRSDNDPYRGSGDFKLTEDYSCEHYIDTEYTDTVNAGSIDEVLNRMKDLVKKIL